MEVVHGRGEGGVQEGGAEVGGSGSSEHVQAHVCSRLVAGNQRSSLGNELRMASDRRRYLVDDRRDGVAKCWS